MADTKVSDLTEIDAVADVDLFYVVDDPAGTPTGKKAPASKLKTYAQSGLGTMAAEAAADYYTATQADTEIAGAVTTHVGEADPHAQYLLESALSANGLTLVGQTFAQMRGSLDLEAGTDFYSISAADTLLAAKVAGPASVTDGRFALFDGTTGKLIKEHTGAPGALAVLSTVGTSQIDDDAVTYAKMQNAASAGFIGATASGNYEHRTPTQVTAALDAFTGDSGSGGVKGLVPAPAAGDAAAGKYLDADGTWSVPAGGGGGSVDDTAYASSWNGVTTDAPSKNAVHDKFEGYLHPGYTAGNWYYAPMDGVLGNSINSAADTIYYTPFILTRRITISDLGQRVATGIGSSNIKLAVYAASSAGLPSGTPLAETASISSASSSTEVSADITGANVTLEAGMYFAAIWFSHANVVVQSVTNAGLSILNPGVLEGATTHSALVGATSTTHRMYSSAEAFAGSWPNATSETLTRVNSNGPTLHFKAA